MSKRVWDLRNILLDKFSPPTLPYKWTYLILFYPHVLLLTYQLLVCWDIALMHSVSQVALPRQSYIN